MNIITVGEDGSKSGIIEPDSIVTIEQQDVPTNLRYVFRLVVMYSETNWRAFRDAKLFYDNDVPEAPVIIDDVSVMTTKPYISILGHQNYSDFLEVNSQQKHTL